MTSRMGTRCDGDRGRVLLYALLVRTEDVRALAAPYILSISMVLLWIFLKKIVNADFISMRNDNFPLLMVVVIVKINK